MGGRGPRVVQLLLQRLGQRLEDLADPVGVPERREMAHTSTRGRHGQRYRHEFGVGVALAGGHQGGAGR